MGVIDERFMKRCFDLARLGAGTASPNPMVGAVLVYKDRIIGEGFYPRDGSAHAEVRAVNSVRQEDRHLIAQSTLYVSLEPCNIHGRTPPCTNLILEERIPKVVVAATDLTPGVQGSGLERLRQAGVEVHTHVLAAEGAMLSQYRNTFVAENRPYVLLKYAQTANGFMAPATPSPYWLTNSFSQRLVHKWRTETDAILVGGGTARIDNPMLTNRLYPGRQPLRVVIDRNNSLPSSLHLFDDLHPTVVFSSHPRTATANTRWELLDFDQPNWLLSLLQTLATHRIAHLTIEGGSWLLQQVVDANCWDEARVFTTPHYWKDGLLAPVLGKMPTHSSTLSTDQLTVFYNN
ncbi:MAG: bifunctional diaminohydroxyphosphoribosylaminopyrimidine deaminase/5-amino-6-(5-phosphoribosylamino)uracil reductase RibD [Saprospiraceae bacterium]